MKKYLILLFVFICGLSNAQEKFQITGKLNDVDENALVLIQKDNRTIDSCYIKNKTFVLNGILEQEPSDVFLIVKNNNTTYYSPLFIGNEKLDLEGSVNNFPYDVKVNGSKYDNQRFEYMQQTKNLHKQKEAFTKEMDDLMRSNLWNDSLQKMYLSDTNPKGLMTKLDDAYQKKMLEFIELNINSHFALRLLDMSKKSFELNDVKELLKKIKYENHNNSNYISIRNYTRNYDLNVGEPFINFKSYDFAGKEIDFSSLFNGKYVLLEFSSMYCGWCDKAIPVVQKIQEKYKKKLDIVVFYIDDEPQAVGDFNKKQTNKWKTLWDPTKKHKDDYIKYKLNTTPTFYLFDKKGILIKKFEGLRTNFEDEVSELIK